MGDEISDETINESIRAFLATKDASEVSLKEIRAHLEEKLSQNLESKRQLIRSTVEDILLEGDADEEQEVVDTGAHQENGAGCGSEDEHNELLNGKKKKKGGGFTKPLLLSEELANFMGTRTASRTEVTKQIWAYIKERDLQNPKNRREVFLDERLQKLMKRKKMMKSAADLTLSSTLDTDEEANDDDDDDENGDNDAMNVDEPPQQPSSSGKRGTKRRNTKTESENEDDAGNGVEETENEPPSTSPTRTRYTAFTVAGSVKKDGTATKSYVKQQVKVEDEEGDKNDNTQPKKKAKSSASNKYGSARNRKPATAVSSNKKGGSMYVQPELLDVLGVSKIKTRPALVKKMWEYINKHKLQDSNDKRVILLDDKLKQVFGVASFTCFSMNKYLSVLCKLPNACNDDVGVDDTSEVDKDEVGAEE